MEVRHYYDQEQTALHKTPTLSIQSKSCPAFNPTDKFAITKDLLHKS